VRADVLYAVGGRADDPLDPGDGEPPTDVREADLEDLVGERVRDP
jgi:hypothetical protein